MPQPMLKESPPPEAQESRPRRRMSPPTPEMLARARELEKELGRPLRTEIAWPLTEKEEEEVIIARFHFRGGVDSGRGNFERIRSALMLTVPHAGGV